MPYLCTGEWIDDLPRYDFTIEVSDSVTMFVYSELPCGLDDYCVEGEIYQRDNDFTYISCGDIYAKIKSILVPNAIKNIVYIILNEN